MRTHIFLMFLLLVFPCSVSADYYRYVDENGFRHYVDTMKKVPKAYQDQTVHIIVPKDGGNLQEEAVQETNFKILKNAEVTLMKENSMK